MPLKPQTGLISDEVICLPAEKVEESCGLSFDIGSTVGKIIYRCNKEYKDGKPIKPMEDAGKGQVHIAMFPRSDVAGMIAYIKENTDLTKNEQGELVVNTSGAGAEAFKKEFREGLQCKIKIITEYDCFCKAFTMMEKFVSKEDFLIPTPPDVQEQIDKTREFLGRMVSGMDEVSDVKLGQADEAQADENRPRLLVMAGSGTGFMQINKDETYAMVDGLFTAGRFMYGLASFLTGENDFNKLVKMAETSDGKTVDTWSNDLIDHTSLEGDNMYTKMDITDDDAMLAFPFGKGINTRLEEVKKEDLAFSTFSTTAIIHAQEANTCCKFTNASDVYFCGNVFNTQFMRSQVLLKVVELQIFFGRNPYEVHFLQNGGMYGALGAFIATEKAAASE